MSVERGAWSVEERDRLALLTAILGAGWLADGASIPDDARLEDLIDCARRIVTLVEATLEVEADEIAEAERRAKAGQSKSKEQEQEQKHDEHTLD